MATQIYARYVPPKAKKNVSEPNIEPLPHDEVADNQSQHPQSKRKRDGRKEPKRIKKKKKIETEAEVIHIDNQAGLSKGHEAVISKFTHAVQISDKLKQQQKEDPQPQIEEPPPKLHDLKPIPQPRPVPEPEYKPTFSSLPPWLAEPIKTDSKYRRPFTSLQLCNQLVDNLHNNGFKTAFPIQSKLIPLMVNGVERHEGDICVSAPTGSGKTFGYLLPIIEELKNTLDRRLRAIVVVPTRELVFQAEQVARMVTSGTSIQVGTAVGSTTLSSEQDRLLKRGQKYDPQSHEGLRAEATRRLHTGFLKDDSLLDDLAALLPGHISNVSSKVDVLICTPGRLVEHIRLNSGFSLEHLQYLVIDEADKLLDESFQEWVNVILNTYESHAARNISNRALFTSSPLRRHRSLRKVILSATMTRDLGKLAALKLQRPTLLALVQDDDSRLSTDAVPSVSADTRPTDSIELPQKLHEIAVPVGTGSNKPLYLHHLIQSKMTNAVKPAKTKVSTGLDLRWLVFVNNTEDAMRLKHILLTLDPKLDGTVETLTKTSSKDGRKVLLNFTRGTIKALIATDRAARGLDVSDLTDVINYDMPRNVTDYVHRVGRTARAEKSGTAWTFFTDSEAAWFWNVIGRSSSIRRHQDKIERTKLELSKYDDMNEKYEKALESLKSAVLSKR